MAKPYARIKDLPNLMQEIKTAKGVLLEQKKEEVRGVITQCMSDIHTLAGVGRATDEVIKSDEEFTKYKAKVAEAKNLTPLDAMITQLQKYKDNVCKHIEGLLKEPSGPYSPNGEKPQKIEWVRRNEFFPIKRLTSREDVDGYLEDIRKKLYDTLDANDEIQIN